MEQAQKAQTEAAQKAQQAAAQVTTYISKATDQLAAKNYDAAIALYDEALKLDPNNAVGDPGTHRRHHGQDPGPGGLARPGRPAAARPSWPARPRPRAPSCARARRPTASRTRRGCTVKKGTQAAELPGKIAFEVEAGVAQGAATGTP